MKPKRPKGQGRLMWRSLMPIKKYLLFYYKLKAKAKKGGKNRYTIGTSETMPPLALYILISDRYIVTIVNTHNHLSLAMQSCLAIKTIKFIESKKNCFLFSLNSNCETN